MRNQLKGRLGGGGAGSLQSVFCRRLSGHLCGVCNERLSGHLGGRLSVSPVESLATDATVSQPITSLFGTDALKTVLTQEDKNPGG